MTQYKSSAKAFLKMAEAAAKAAYKIFKKDQSCFLEKLIFLISMILMINIVLS